jgi:phosphoglycolate phosphatase
VKAVIWDLDGTLLDTPPAIVDIAIEVAGELGREPDPAAIRAGIGLPLPVALGTLLGEDPHGPVTALAVERYRELWVAKVTPRISHLVFPGVLAGLARLQARGVRQAVATGKAQSGAESNVRLAGFAPFMEVVVGYDRVPRPKPAPDMALLVLRELGLSPDDAVMVGDATHDLLMARDAGLRSIGVTYGAQEEAALRSAAPTWLAHSFAEAMRILEEAVAA